MANVNALIQQRMQKGERTSKMAAMAEQSASGNLSSFSGIFSVTPLNENEKLFLENLLKEFASSGKDIDNDLHSLIAITSEVKAINNQAAILHGERIKKVHTLLTAYRDGAFTAWLIAAYGNRQTPYNLMQYYEFYMAIPSPLRGKLESMPRQAIYTLATRKGSLDKKRKIVENFNGETKAQLLTIIRDAFPLAVEDQRRQNEGESFMTLLQKLCDQYERRSIKLTTTQKRMVVDLLENLQQQIQGGKV